MRMPISITAQTLYLSSGVPGAGSVVFGPRSSHDVKPPARKAWSSTAACSASTVPAG